jgi:hypothetical protein
MQKAELVALRVGQHRPRDMHLADIGRNGAERAQPNQFASEIIVSWTKVEVQPKLAALLVARAVQHECGRVRIVGRSYLDLVFTAIHYRPPENFAPEGRQLIWVAGVED